MEKTRELLRDALKGLAMIAIQHDTGELEVLKAVTDLHTLKQYLNTGLDLIDAFESQNIEAVGIAVKDSGGYGDFMIEIIPSSRVVDFSEVEEWQMYNSAREFCEAKYTNILDAMLSGDQTPAEVDMLNEIKVSYTPEKLLFVVKDPENL